MPTDPCRALRRVSRYLSRWVDGQPEVGEESLTDWLLFESRRLIPNVYYRKFKRLEEGRKTGADWDWCIIGPKRSFTFRVQAKRARRGEDFYPALVYSNRHGLQIDRLLSSAKHDNVRPLYSIYPDPIAGTPTNCCTTLKAKRRMGAFLIPAAWLYKTFVLPARQRVDVPKILVRALPLKCLACCILATQDLEAFFRRFLDDTDDGTAAGLPADIGVTTSPPPWAQSLMSVSQAREEVPEWWDKEFRHLSDNTDALLVWDLRPERATGGQRQPV